MKNKKIKIYKDRPELSSDEINAMQDFKDILNQSQLVTKPIYKNYWFIVGTTGVIVATLAVIAFLKLYHQNNPELILSNTQNTPFIRPASQFIEIPFTTFEVESGKGDTLHLQNGGRIIIPPCPFMDGSGNTVNGKVDIQYREFRDPIDIAISGIPMEYDSGGVKYHFESSGMCEIVGKQFGKPVYVQPGCPIEIEMVPVKQHPKYNLYYLDTLSKNWVFKGKPEWKERGNHDSETIQPVDYTFHSRKNSIKNEISKLQKTKPVAPIASDESLPHFTLNFKPNEFPELEAYKNTIFEVNPEDKKRSVALFGITWSNLSYKTIVSGKTYLVIMELIDKRNQTLLRKEEMEVHPVIKQEDFAEAMATFKKLDKEYSEKLAKKKEDLRKLEEDLKLRQQKQKEEFARTLQRLDQLRAKNFEVQQAFAVSDFGIYNCDWPYLQTNCFSRKVHLVASNGSSLNATFINQAFLNRNALITYNCNTYAEIRFGRNDETILFSILPDGKIAYVSKEMVNAFLNSNNTDIQPVVSEQSFSSVAEIKHFFGLAE